MDTIKKTTTMVGIVTLIVGLALGLGVGVWSMKSSQASNAPAAQHSLSATGKDEPSFATNDSDPFRQMERMQEEIDRAIRNATEQFQLGPGATAFRPDAGYSSSFDLRDRKDRFELRAYLPDVKASDVNVKIDNDRTLHVSVSQRKQETKNTSAGSASFTELGRYEQVVTLPEPVKSSDMKIERKGHEVVITVPKANAS
jgi:HSP20 family molecular chaperone IbpA